ncbi:MAG: ATP-dependent DNA ligase [Burkholderiales bacterium]|nr:ATP-dependent DNA ligase [Burkholderiales bacterium]
MQAFARLFAELDAQTATAPKVAALTRYFAASPPRDAAWAVYFLAGGKPRRAVPTKLLREAAARAAGIEEWLFDTCYESVGDLAETIALILPHADGQDTLGLADWVETRILPLKDLGAEDMEARLNDYWRALDRPGRFLLGKLIGGGFRVGVSRLLVTRALAQVAGLHAKLIAQRMIGYTDAKARPGTEEFLALIAPPSAGGLAAGPGAPYPFFLAHTHTDSNALGDARDWQVEWKFDGIRAQVVRREGRVWIWSRGEELVTERFPEIARAAEAAGEGSVFDGEIVVWQNDRPAPFAVLQQRLNRKTVSTRLQQSAPATFIAYDLLELEGRDLRWMPQHARRSTLEATTRALAGEPAWRISPLLDATDWDTVARQRAAARAQGVEGVMLKQKSARYGSGRTREEGLWLKWKVDPYAVDCVLVYAQSGHGRRAGLYSDYTFALWDERDGERRLVPFAKAYSGLTDTEMREVDAIVKKTIVEKFGPVRAVTPTLVFELGFEGIARSPRHKSGVAVRFPRMLRWRRDKRVEEADTLATLMALLDAPA